MDQNLGDTNVMYHNYWSQNIKVSINIGIKQI